ncbi:MAG: ferritin family protein [Bacteroidales bacterium]|nr:ferritin family protein [Bacteroidales bacterium]
MEDFKNINDILDFAIQNEQNAVDFYNSLATNARTADMKQTFEQFAREEIAHKARLTKIKEEGIFDMSSETISTLNISDYLVRTEAKPDMSYEEALVLAMKREKAAFKLYSKLAEKAPNENLKNIFKALAMEESKHKLRFEIEYDEFVLREN